MKVLHIIETLKSGGKERQVLELVRGMIVKGHDPHVLVQSNDIEYSVSDLAGRVHTIPRRTRWDLGLVGRMRSFVNQSKPDLIHTWGPMCSVYAVPVSHFGRIPFVSGHIRDAPSHLPMSDKRWWHGRIAQPFASAVVANSKAGLSAYRATGPKGHVIYNGFDFAGRTVASNPEFAASLGIATRHAVAMVARFGAHKDHATYFAAADHVLRDRDDVTFIAIGDGPGLKEWQARYCDNPRVLVLGRRDDVERIVANMTLGVLVTQMGAHGEGISNALTEMLAAGKPVIATDDGGNRELVSDNGCGILVPQRDVGALADALNALLDDSDRTQALGKKGRKAVLKHFTRDKMVSAYLKLYGQVLGGRLGVLEPDSQVSQT